MKSDVQSSILGNGVTLRAAGLRDKKQPPFRELLPGFIASLIVLVIRGAGFALGAWLVLWALGLPQ